MDPHTSVSLAKHSGIAISLCYCILGGVLLAPFHFPTIQLCYILGILLLSYGIVRVIGYFSRDLYSLAFQFDFALGIFTMAVGAVLLARARQLEPYLYPIFGLMVLNDALSKLQTCLDARQFGLVSLWWKLMLLSLASGLFGFLLLVHPFAGAADMIHLMGLAAFTEGVLNLLSIVFLVKTQGHCSFT